MSDKICNVKPEENLPIDPASQPLPPGIHAPQDVVSIPVEETQAKNSITDGENKQNALEHIESDIISTEIPDVAVERLYEMAYEQGHDNIIFASSQVRVLNLQPSTKTDDDYTMLNAIRSGVIEAKSPPSSVDLRADWWDVSDQGASGACVGFGTADGLLRYLFTKQKSINPGERLASGILWQAAKETDTFTDQATTFIALEGTSIKAALTFAQSKGIVRESVAPFGTLYTKDAATFYRLAAQLRLSGVYNLGKNFNNWKQWLSTSGPIVAAINVDSSFEKCSGNGKLDKYDVNNIFGGHCICFVGYTSDNRIIIRNSWGTQWGDKGFAYASVDWIMKACLEAYGAVI